MLHTGCDPPNASSFCGKVVLAHSSTSTGGGHRFAYDSGGRQVGWTEQVDARYSISACARICSDWLECIGFVVIHSSSSAPPRCVAVNDTTATVGTVLTAESYIYDRNASCQIDCGARDGLGFVFSAANARTLAPAALGGVEECSLLCDRLAGCMGFGIEQASGTCFPVSSTATTRHLSSRILSYATTTWPSRTPSVASSLSYSHDVATNLSWWLAPPTRHVFERDEQWMSAYCSRPPAVDWAAAPGSAAAAQLAIRVPPGVYGVTFNFRWSALVGVGGAMIGAAHARAHQVGMVRARQGALYRSELGDEYYGDILAPIHSALQLRPNVTRVVWLSLDVPRNATAGVYVGALHAVHAATGVTAFSVPLNLTVWPINATCLDAEHRKFGKAWGFDRSILNALYPNGSAGGDAAAEAEALLCATHTPPEAIAGQQVWANTRPLSELERLLAPPCAQPLVSGAYLGGFVTSPTPANFTPAFADSVLDRVAPRVAALQAAGLLERSYLYGFDESHEQYRPAVALLFGRLKARWPSAKTLAVLNWEVMPDLPIDIWVVQYELLDQPTFVAAKAAMQAAGRQVWGYHCVSPSAATQLNSFVDVPLIKSRLLPWLSAAHGLDGWLYWFTDWGAGHAPSANATGTLRPLKRLGADGRSGYDPAVGTTTDGHYTNEDGNLIYMGVDGPLSSARLEALRLGMEDRALLSLLGRETAARLATSVAATSTNWTLSIDALEAARRHAASLVGVRAVCPPLPQTKVHEAL